MKTLKEATTTYRRHRVPNLEEIKKVSSSQKMATVFRAIWKSEDIDMRERMYILYLNHANIPIAYSEHSVGTICATTIDRRLVLAEALNCGATCIALCHNHLSGQLTLSQPDIQITKEIKAACEIMDIKLLDHIILSGENEDYYSFADNGGI